MTFFSCSPHPYIFFNEDRMSMTFLGFLLNQNGDLLNPASSEVLVPKLVDPTLRGQLKHQGVDFDVNYEKRDRLDYVRLFYHSSVFKNCHVFDCMQRSLID